MAVLFTNTVIPTQGTFSNQVEHNRDNPYPVSNYVYTGTVWVPMTGSTGGVMTVDTELPAARVASDALSNPTAPDVLADLVVWDVTGSQWVRAKGYGTTGVQQVLSTPVADANAGPTQYKDFGSVTAAFIKASAGNVYSLVVFNANAAVRYVQLHNKATIPLATEVPLCSYPVPAGTANNPGVTIIENTHLMGLRFTTGIGWAISTTLATFTDAATAANHSIEVMYK